MQLLTMDIVDWDGMLNGVKENCYFAINNSRTISRHDTAYLRTTAGLGTQPAAGQHCA